MKITICCLIVLMVYPVLSEGPKKQPSSENETYNFQNELAKLLKIKKPKLLQPENLKKIVSNLKITLADPIKILEDKTLCGICHLVIKGLQNETVPLLTIAKAICNVFVDLETWTISNFCDDILRINLPILEYILKNSKILSPDLACSVLLQNKQCYDNETALKWKLEVPSKSQLKIPQIERDPNAKPLKILHLSDFHITVDYEVGGVDNCGYPICCKKNLGNRLFGRNAGAWGDYNCDIPLSLFKQTMLYINQTHKDIDLVYFTGDVIDHTIWNTSIKENSNILTLTYRTLLETFPNVTVLPVIGNHETAPVNAYPPNEENIEKAGFSTKWLYDLLAKLWRKWLSKEALVTIKKQGYYSYTVNKKFKIIALNNNICYNLNWWVLYNTTFLNEQLQFLSKELEQSEKREQFVHIITHVAVGNKDCIEPWEVNYNNLVKRFSHIIKGQFFGHTHTDELKIFYNDSHVPINVAYNGASLTTFQKYNPNYKVVMVDPNSYDVLDIDTYYFNLTEANQHPNRPPVWLKLYSMKEAYGLKDLSPINVNKIATNIFSNKTLFYQYWRFYVRDGDDSLKDGCDEQCKKEIICKIVTTYSIKSERQECE